MVDILDKDLEAKALLKRFGSHTAVDALSFGVRRGSFFSILGLEVLVENVHHGSAATWLP